MHMCFLAISHQYYHIFFSQSHRLLFSHAFAEMRGEITPERKVASTGDRTRNHKVMNPTRKDGKERQYGQEKKKTQGRQGRPKMNCFSIIKQTNMQKTEFN